MLYIIGQNGEANSLLFVAILVRLMPDICAFNMEFQVFLFSGLGEGEIDLIFQTSAVIFYKFNSEIIVTASISAIPLTETPDNVWQTMGV